MSSRKELTHLAVAITRAMKNDTVVLALPPSEITASASLEHWILPITLFKRCTRGYILKVVYQINRTYGETCYDACGVMIRRLVETLIIEVYEAKGIDYKIKDPNNNNEFKSLKNLIDTIKSEPNFNLSRNCKKGLDDMKSIGDLSAHNRKYNAHREDIDKIQGDLRVTVQELLTLAGLY